MYQIHKYALLSPETKLDLPWDTQILDAVLQDDVIMVYALVDTTHTKVPWTFTWLFTGTVFNEVPGIFLKTLTTNYGIVWHVFYTVQNDCWRRCAFARKTRHPWTCLMWRSLARVMCTRPWTLCEPQIRTQTPSGPPGMR